MGMFGAAFLALCLIIFAERGFSAEVAGDVVVQARALEKAGKVDQAEQLLANAITRGLSQADIFGTLGLIHYRAGKFHDAVLELGRAAQLAPDSSEYSLKLAAAILAERRYSVALEYLRSVENNFSMIAEYQYNIGLAYYGLRRFEESLGAFRNAVRLAPKMDLAHFFLGNVLVANADLPGAVSAYRRAIALNPRRSGYYSALGKTLGEVGQEHRKEAISLLLTALRMQPNNSASEFELAKLYEASGDARAAKPLLESVTGRFPDEVAPRVVLARVYTKLGESENAKAQFESIRRLERSRSGVKPESSLAGSEPSSLQGR